MLTPACVTIPVGFRLGCLVLLVAGCASRAVLPDPILLADDEGADIVVLTSFDGIRVFLRSSESGFYSLREVSLEDESGTTLLEIGDDTGMKDYPSHFVPAQSEFVVSSRDILQLVFRNASMSERKDEARRLRPARTLHLTFFADPAASWPIPTTRMRHERCFTLAIPIEAGALSKFLVP